MSSMGGATLTGSSEDDFLCSVCLDVFSEPVSAPCGHNFCKSCIGSVWDLEVRPRCPMCKQVYQVRPELRVNTFIAHMVSQFRREVPEDQKSAAGGLKVVDPHLDPHLGPHLDHRLAPGPKPPGFGPQDQAVPLREESEGKRAELQQRIHQRRQRMEEVRCAVRTSRHCADGQKAEGVQVFGALKDLVDRGLDRFLKELEEEQAALESQAEEVLVQLEDEVSALRLLSASEDQIPLLKPAPPTEERAQDRTLIPPAHQGAVARAAARLQEVLGRQVQQLKEAELRRVRGAAVDLTLDPRTANPLLVLSQDGKQVYCGDEDESDEDPADQDPSDQDRLRFSHCLNVLATQSFSSGRFYFEVQVRGKSSWTVGVARASVTRAGEVTLSPAFGFWTLWLRPGDGLRALSAPSRLLSVAPPPERVGVFVDYEGGVVSFYDAQSAAPVFSFRRCAFAHRLLPFFSPGLSDGGGNSAPLVICPVDHSG